MSRIISYPYDSNVVDDDAWIGTEASTTRTKQYTASAVADYLNINGKISIGGQLAYQYVVDPLQAAGTFSITSGGLDNVPFANITALTLSMTDRGGQNVVAFLNYLVGSDILISKQNEISSFGHYEVVSYNVNPNDSQFYDLVVVFKGGNGSMNFLDFYDAINFTLASEIIGLYTFNVDSDNGVPFTVQNNDTIDFTSTNITVSNIDSAISFNLPVTGVTAGAYTAANITVDSFGRITDAADGASGPGGTGTTNFVTKWVNATTLGNSVIFDNGTNVGIGTTNPATKLDVSGTGQITSRIVSTDNSGARFDLHSSGGGRYSQQALANGDFFMYDETNNHTIQRYFDGASGAWTWYTAGTEKMRITSVGNVGIGTTSPSAKLQIQQSTDNVGIRVFGFDDRSSEYVGIHDNGSSGTFASTSNIKLQAGGSGYAFIDSASDIYIDVGASSNDFKFRVPGIGEIFTIKGLGNVGIGNTNPSEKLEIGENGGQDNSIKINSDTSGSYLKIKSLGNLSGLQATNNQNLNLNSEGVSGYFTVTTAGSERMKVNYNGNVGIGTTNPSEKLEVSSDSSPTIKIQDTTNNVELLLTVDDSNSFLESSSNMLFRTNGSNNRMVIDSSGNVGIGTNSPSEKLEVIGKAIIRRTGTATAHSDTDLLVTDATTAGSTAQLEILGGNVGNSFLYFSDTDSYQQGGIQYQHSSDSMNFRVNASTAMSIASSRNVGIGTTSPSSKLHVEGTLQVIETTPITAEPNSSRIIAAIDSRGGTDTGGLGIYTGDTNNDEPALLITNYLDAEKFRILGASGDIRSAGLIRSTAYGSGNVTGTAAYNLSVDSSGNVIETAAGGGGSSNWTVTGNDIYNSNSGNVGIGVINPGNKLDINGSVNVPYGSSNGYKINTNRVMSQTGNGLEIGILNAPSVYANIQINNSGEFRIEKNGSNLMLVNSSGNVGIGTTTPNAKLDVNGNISIATTSGSTASNQISMVGSRASFGYDGSIASAFMRSSDTSKPLVFGSGSSELMRIVSSTGNVGIGTTSASFRLDVESTSLSVARFKSTGSKAIIYLSEADEGGLISTESNRLCFGSSAGVSTANMNYHMSTESLGIGTASPLGKLHVESGSVGVVLAPVVGANELVLENSGDAGLSIFTPNTNKGSLVFGDPNDAFVGGLVYDHSNNKLTFKVNNSDEVAIDSTGNVGIGTTSPSGKLEVNGSVKIGNVTTGLAMNGDSATEFLISGVDTGGNAWNSIHIKADGNDGFFIEKDTNNVGIGTTSPHRKLTVTGAAGSAPLLALKNTSTSTANDVSLSFIRDNDDSKGFTIGINSANDAFNISKSGSIVSTDVKLTIADDGNVGIGTTSPHAKLHVDGAIKVGTAQTLAAASTTVGAIRYRATTGASYMEMVMQTGVSGGIPVFAWIIIKENNW